MGRTKEYANAGERQAAYRARHREKEPPLQGYLAALARTLHTELRETAQVGRSPVPAELIGRRADETLRNLIRYLERLREEGDAGGDSPQGKGGETEAESD
jgi:hypothetical protein